MQSVVSAGSAGALWGYTEGEPVEAPSFGNRRIIRIRNGHAAVGEEESQAEGQQDEGTDE